MSSKFDAPKRASTSHLIHLIGIENFRKELAKQQKAKASGILEVISATSIRREAPPTERELMMMKVVDKMHQDGEIDDLVWSQVKAMYIYIGADKDKNGYVEASSFIYPEDWEPSRDLSFAKKLLPKFLSYQLQQYQELGNSIDKIIEASTLQNTQKADKEKLSPDEVQKAEELAYWNVIKDSKDKRDFQSFIKRFKGGFCERLAYVRMEELAWGELGDNPGHRALSGFLKDFPYGRYADTAKEKIQDLAKRAEEKRKSKPVLNKLASVDLSSAFTKKNEEQPQVKTEGDETIETMPPKQSSYKLSGKAIAALCTILFLGVVAANFFATLEIDESVKTFVGHSKALKTATFTPDGQNILSGSEDQTLKLWDIKSGNEVRTFFGHSDIISSVTISPDGNYALSGSNDSTMKLWDIKTGDLLKTFDGHQNWVVSVAFSSDGKYALSGSHDKTIKMWDIAKGNLMKTFEGHKDWVISVAFSADNKKIISGSHDKTLKIWDIRSGRSLKTLKGHRDWVTSVSVSNQTYQVLSGSYDESLKLWNINTGKAIRTFKTENTSAITSVAFTPDLKAAISSSFDDRLILWDLTTGKPTKILKGHFSSRANYVAISPDGRYALSAGQDKKLKLWKLQHRQTASQQVGAS